MRGEIEGNLPKVLLVAEHASALFGGEALIPFQYFKQLRKMGVDAHLLVHQRTKCELLKEFPQDADRLHFVSDSLINVYCHRLSQLLPSRIAVFTTGALSHFDTQIRQRRLAKSLIRQFGFDVVHEPIPVSPKLPSMLFGLAAPVVIGPMNGGMDYPVNFNKNTRLQRALIKALRSTASFWNSIFRGKREAAVLLVANGRTFEALPTSLKTKNVVHLVDNGVDTNLFRPLSKIERNNKFKVIHIGRLVDVKRVDLLIAACARIKRNLDFQLDVVGDGPLRSELAAQAELLGIGNLVRFHGRQSHVDTAKLLGSADVLAFTSMHDCGGAVILEALASGVPVVATEWGGPIDYVTKEVGILVPPTTEDMFVREFADALLWMANNPASRGQMAEAGRLHVLKNFAWTCKAKALIAVYKSVVHERRDKSAESAREGLKSKMTVQ